MGGRLFMLPWTSVVRKSLEIILRDQVRNTLKDSAWLGTEKKEVGEKNALLSWVGEKISACIVRHLLGIFSLQVFYRNKFLKQYVDSLG